MSDEKNPDGKAGAATGEKVPLTPEQEAAIIAKKNAAGDANYAAKGSGGEGGGTAKS